MPLFTSQDAALVAAHLRYMTLIGQSDITIYARARTLHRLTLAIGVLATATPIALCQWRMSLEVAPGTVVHYVSHVKEWYRWLQREGHRPDNPAELIPVPKMPRYLPRPISDEQLAHAIATADRRVRPWLVLAAWCGLRAKEIALLRWECVLDSAAPPVLLVASDATKGRKERAVPLHEFAAGELAALPGRRAGWVFARYDGRPGPNKPHLISLLANTHLHESGSPATLHQLRHWFGTQTYHVQRDLRVVQELLGHSSPKATAGYAAYDNADAAEAVNALPVPSALRPVSRGTRSRARTANRR